MDYTLENLVENFSANLSSYKDARSRYNEHSTRIEYIDPFLELLGWDVKNIKGIAPNLREVIPENYSKQGARPDYTFTVRGIKKFFLEAKKPQVDIINDPEPALQARRYGLSAGHYIVVLTNFENLLIYDTTVMPREGDSARVALLKSYHFTEYTDKWEEIKSYLSREVVFSNKFEDQFKHLLDNRSAISIDKYFLKQINDWRLELANDLYLNHPEYPLSYINDITQTFINQMVFLRICEDRNLPTYHKLYETISDTNEMKNELVKVIKEADKRYNSGIFENSKIVFDLDNEIILKMIESLYYPQSPFIFNVIEANVLGEIYELFLSEKLTITADNRISLSKKAENLNRDVVSTPTEIVKYMVKKSLTPIIQNKSPQEISNLKIADIACGSGIFLTEVFAFLIDYFKQWYLQNDKRYLNEGENGQHYLPFEDKKEILTSCIYGLDIDPNAVEVAKFSLLLKLLEDESTPTIGYANSLLPDLVDNIKVGNALVDFKHIQGRKIDDKEKIEISAFNWSFGKGVSSFDAIVGNPPYVNTSDMKSILPSEEIFVYEKKYRSSYKQYDKYMLFVERAIDKLKDNGYLCYIVPNKFSKIEAGKKLRELLTENSFVTEFLDFGSSQLFKDKKVTIYSSILLVQKRPQKTFTFEEVNNMQEWWANQNENEDKLNRVTFNSNILTETPWVLVSDSQKAKLVNKLYENSTLLGESNLVEIFNGIQTSAERPVPIYWFSDEEIIQQTTSFIKVCRDGKEYRIERNILKPYFKPTKISERNLNTYDIVEPNKWIIFPYDLEGKLYSQDQMENLFPGTWEYLKDNYDRLLPKQVSGKKDGRDVPHASEDTWYHYGRIQALTRFINTPKLIVGILTRNPLYLYDDQDMLIASGGTAGYCAVAEKENSPYKLEFIQAVLNHPAIDWLCSIVGSDFDNDFYSRGTSVLQRLPIINIDFENELQRKLYFDVVSKTRRIYEVNNLLNKPSIDKRENNALINEKEELIKNIRDDVSDLYGIRSLMHVIGW